MRRRCQSRSSPNYDIPFKDGKVCCSVPFVFGVRLSSRPLTGCSSSLSRNPLTHISHIKMHLAVLAQGPLRLLDLSQQLRAQKRLQQLLPPLLLSPQG